MKNIRLDLEYDGGAFHGWQRQKNNPSVQECIENVIASVLGKRVPLHAAGRTDTGVSAKHQVANFNTDYGLLPEKWADLLNANLPPSIRIQSSSEVPANFHSLKMATSKIYEYRILNRRVPSALDRWVYFYPGQLDWDAMEKALPQFIGTKDFRAFQGPKASVKTTTRTLYRFELDRSKSVEGFYRFELEGSGFLKQMVRAIMGTVLDVGLGRRDVQEIESIIASKDRRRAGRTLPAEGLCLLKVSYDPPNKKYH